jgi:hypothetical protein
VKVLLALGTLVVALYVTWPIKAASGQSKIERIICGVFGPYCAQALRVAWCESRFETTAANGQYLGLFQMGANARSRYGQGGDPWTQSESAFRYFADSGFSWGPWQCKP